MLVFSGAVQLESHYIRQNQYFPSAKNDVDKGRVRLAQNAE